LLKPLLCVSLSVSLIASTSFASAQTAALPRADGASTPIKRYGPPGGCGPLMIISHGLGGSENGNGGLASAMANEGWRVIVMGHRESGRAVLREALFSTSPRQNLVAAATTPAYHRARFLDLDAAVAEATRNCRPSRFILAGHSMGAMTTMLEAGSVAKFGRFGSNRFDAYVAISPQGIGFTYDAGAWARINKPVLMITGTRDQGSEGGYETRVSAFDGLPAGAKRFAIIAGAGHLSLSADGQDQVARKVGALTIEYLNALGKGRALTPTSVAGVDVRDK
jgi:pimeloyl-ACP methyl ester carboxylesterase